MWLTTVKIDELDRLRVPTEGERELGRALTLLENDRTGSVTVAALRERGVRAPAQAVYDLQLAGFAIDRITSTGPGGRTTPGYRLRNPEHGELDQNADRPGARPDDDGRQADTRSADCGAENSSAAKPLNESGGATGCLRRRQLPKSQGKSDVKGGATRWSIHAT